jgi:hypothetical protein
MFERFQFMETHSAWSVNLIGVSGRTCALNWCTLRKWAGSRVVYERHYDHPQSGESLTSDDLRLNPHRPVSDVAARVSLTRKEQSLYDAR